MSRLRPFAYSTGATRPNTTIPQQHPTGNQSHAKQMQGLEQDIDQLPHLVNFVPRESIDASVQVRIFKTDQHQGSPWLFSLSFDALDLHNMCIYVDIGG